MSRNCKVSDIGVTFEHNANNTVKVAIARPFAKEVCVWSITISENSLNDYRDEIIKEVRGACALNTAYLRMFALDGIEKLYQ